MAVDEFKASLDSLIVKRSEVQRTRVRSDAELFALLGHPFNFRLRQESYDTTRNLLVKSCESIEFDPNEADSVRFAVSAWLNKAHFIYESSLTKDFQRQREQITERDEIIIARGETINRFQQDLADSERKKLLLSAELS